MAGVHGVVRRDPFAGGSYILRSIPDHTEQLKIAGGNGLVISYVHDIGLSVDTVLREVGTPAQHRLRNMITGSVELAQHDKFVVEYPRGDPRVFLRNRDFRQAGFVLRCLFIPHLGVIEHPYLDATFVRGVYGIDDGLEFVLIDGNVERPLAVPGARDERENFIEQTVLQPFPGLCRPLFDGKIFIIGEQFVQFGELASKGLARGDGTVEDHAVIFWFAVVGGYSHFERFVQLGLVRCAVYRMHAVLAHGFRLDAVVRPTKFLNGCNIARRSVPFWQGVRAVRKRQTVQ